MELHLVGEEEIPRPPAETRFRSARAEPLGDHKRIRVEFELTPFQQRPDIDIEVRDGADTVVSNTSIIENVDVRVGLTLHLRGEPTGGPYKLLLTLTYPDLGQTDGLEIVFDT